MDLTLHPPHRRCPVVSGGATASVPLLLAAALLAGAWGAPAIGAQERAADPDDVSTLDGIIRAYYEVVSGPAGGTPDRERDRTLHLPGAVVGLPVPDGQGGVRIETMSLDGYHDRFGGPRQEGFWEREIHREVHRFGNVAHVMSTYASSTTPQGELFARGINSIQLTWDGERWWIVSWIFDQERPDNPIPDAFLPGEGEGPGAAGSHGEEAPVAAADPAALSPGELARRARALHQERRVGEAGRLYRALLDREPPAEPTAEERRRVVGLAPVLRIHPDEPFELEEVVAVLHPQRRMVAYHLFWDDDIDYPDDQEPTDHEVVWVEHDAQGVPTALTTYFHGELIRVEGTAATRDGRPRVAVEWGKHGSLPGSVLASAQELPAAFRANWERLRSQGTRRAGHPLARGWPTRFPGSFEDYGRLARELDLGPVLEARGTVVRTARANAVLDQHFLPYNFSAKTEWP